MSACTMMDMRGYNNFNAALVGDVVKVTTLIVRFSNLRKYSHNAR